MSPSDLQNWIGCLTDDIEFTYQGISGSICPFSLTDISVSYGDDERTFDSIESAMNTPFICGKPLSLICQDFDF